MDRKTFDINGPSRSVPSATSRPVIVGHQPIMSDPMMRPAASATTAPGQFEQSSAIHQEPPAMTAHVPKVIPVTEAMEHDLAMSQPAAPATAQPPLTPALPNPMAPPMPQDLPMQPSPTVPDGPMSPGPEPPMPTPPSHDSPDGAPVQQLPQVPQQDLSHIPHVPVTEHHRQFGFKHLLIWVAIVGFLALFGAYLLADAGIIPGNSKLPLHIFKQEQVATADTATATKASAPAAASGTTAASGTKEYKDGDLHFSFQYPASWSVSKYYNADVSAPYYVTYAESAPAKIKTTTDGIDKEAQAPFFIGLLTYKDALANHPTTLTGLQKCQATSFTIPGEPKAHSLVYADNQPGSKVRALYLSDELSCAKAANNTFSISDKFTLTNSKTPYTLSMGYYQSGMENTSTVAGGPKLGLEQARILSLTGGGVTMADKAAFEATTQYKEALTILATLKAI